MARKAQREWMQVSDLVGRIEFSVSAGKDASDKRFIPETKGFAVEIAYESRSDEKYHALCDSVVAVQNSIKRYYWEHRRFPFQPVPITDGDGNVHGDLKRAFKVKGDGAFDAPNTVLQDRVEAQIKAGEMDLATKIRYAQAMGLPVPAEWLTANPVVTVPPVEPVQGTAPVVLNLKYNVDHLKRAKDEQLMLLCQQEEFEDVDSMTRSEMIEELVLVEKDNA